MKNNKIQDITVSGLFLALSIVASVLTSNWIPKLPLINGHLDFWYGICIVGIFFIRSLDIKIIYIIALPFGMLISELPSYAGIYDYFLETGFPLFAIIMFVPLSYIQNKYFKLSLIIIAIGIWTSIRFIGQSYAGMTIWGVPTFAASAIYNAPNTFGDLILIYPLVIFCLTSKVLVKYIKNENRELKQSAI